MFNYYENLKQGLPLNFRAVTVPIFAVDEKNIVVCEDTMEIKTDEQEICVLDVKELYDAAYDAKGDDIRFKALMAEAVKLDMAYRKQLACRNNRFSTPQPIKAKASEKDSKVA